jgi:hypothetical protein
MTDRFDRWRVDNAAALHDAPPPHDHDVEMIDEAAAAAGSAVAGSGFEGRDAAESVRAGCARVMPRLRRSINCAALRVLPAEFADPSSRDRGTAILRRRRRRTAEQRMVPSASC